MRTNRKSSGRGLGSQHGEDAEGGSGKRVKEAPKRIPPKMLRIIGGDLKRRTVLYNGDRQTRPMKDSVRENLFNILGGTLAGAVAWDLFAGTGIIAIESISRGATRAIAIDLSRDCSRLIRSEAAKLGIEDRLDCLTGDAFRLAPTRLKFEKDERRVVFCCPPYKLWETKLDVLNQLLTDVLQNSAAGSFVVAETDNKFAVEKLPEADWDVRTYGNTKLAIAEVTGR